MLSLRAKRCNQDRDETLATGAVIFVEAGGEGTVEIEDAGDLASLNERHHKLGARRRIAGDMAGKFVHVRHDYRGTCCRRRAADAPAPGNAHAGRPALKGSED